MAKDDFAYRTACQTARDLAAERADLNAEYTRAQQVGDEHTAAQAHRRMAELDLVEQAAANIYNRHVYSQQPQQRYVSDQQRSQREPGEMDAYDVAKVCGISPEEYLRQCQGLAYYKRSRGIENK